MCDKDKCAVIAKQLNDFLYMYYRETDLYTDSEDRTGCVSNIHFAQFLYSARLVVCIIKKITIYNEAFICTYKTIRKYYSIIKNLIKKNQLHAVSRTQQGRQREPSVKTLRSPLSAEKT